MLESWIITGIDGANRRTLSPVADDFIIEDVQEDDAALLYRRGVSSELVLVGDDFDWLRALDQSGCVDVYIEAVKDTFTLTGLVDLKKLTFEDNRCKVGLTFTTSPAYVCLEDDNEVDLLRSTTIDRQTVKLALGDLEFFSCPTVFQFEYTTFNPETANDACPTPDAIGWVVTDRSIDNIVFQPNPRFALADITITYARLVFDNGTNVSPGDGWQLVSGTKYAREPTISVAVETGSAEEGSIQYTATPYSSDDVIDNTLLLNDVIEYFLNVCAIRPWRSVFFGKDAPAIADPVVYPQRVYDWAYQNMHHVILAQKSDVKRFDNFQNATKATMSWGKLLDLFRLLNLKIGYQGNIFIIEHASYFQGVQGLDLSLSPYAEQLAGLESYKGRGAELAKKISFAWMDETDSIFDGVPILFDCGDSEKREDFVTDTFTSNIQAMLGDNSNIEDLGFAIMAPVLSGTDYVLTATTNVLFPAESPLNGALALPNIQDYLWMDDANFTTGTLNMNAVTFNSTKPQRETEAVILIDWEDYKLFDPANLVNCWYGPWRVSRASYSDKNCRLELGLEG